MEQQPHPEHHERFWPALKGPVRIVVAIVMLILGVIGWILPIMPGWPFAIAGVLLLAPNHRLSKWLLAKARRSRERSSTKHK